MATAFYGTYHGTINKNLRVARTFKHLDYLERLFLAYFLKQGYSKAASTKKLGVHRSTIYRELKRNTDDVSRYHALLAEKRLNNVKLKLTMLLSPH